MKDEKKHSIYEYICIMAKENPWLPYNFINEELDGENEFRYIYLENNFTEINREKASREVMKKIEEKTSLFNDLEEAIDNEKPFVEYNLVFFVKNLWERINIYLNEELINKDKLYALGHNLATQSTFEEDVKLGIIILGFFKNDLSQKIIRTLGLHSSLTAYAIEATKNHSDYNKFLFDLLNNTIGYGKMMALITSKAICKSQQEITFKVGAKNSVLPNISAGIVLGNPDLEDYYKNLVLDKNNFKDLSYLLAYGIENENLKELNVSYNLIEKYINNTSEFASDFIDLAAILEIERNFEDDEYMYTDYYLHENKKKKDDKDNIKYEIKNGWTIEREVEIKKKCNSILKKRMWRSLLMKEVNNPLHKTSLIIKGIKKLNIELEFESFISILNNDLFDMEIMQYLLVENSEKYLDDVYNYLKAELPSEVLENDPQKIEEKDINYLHQPDIWAVYLIKAMKIQNKYDEEFLIKAITSRFSDLRIQGISALKKFNYLWSDKVIVAIGEALKEEPSKEIREKLYKLKRSKVKGLQKVQEDIKITIKRKEKDLENLFQFPNKYSE